MCSLGAAKCLASLCLQLYIGMDICHDNSYRDRAFVGTLFPYSYNHLITLPAHMFNQHT
jgi:hypothetical protein